jgi:hypothetical protein
MTDTKKKVYLAVRKPSPMDGNDPLNGYLSDKQYIDKKDGVYLNK